MTTVRDILDRKGYQIIVVLPDDTVLEAARRMKEERIGAVVVHTDEQGVVGIFSERDVLRRVVAEGKPAESTLIRDVMSRPVACCTPDTSLNECQKTMTEKRLRHLPVVDNEQLVGMISGGDILAQEVQVQQTTIDYLHGYLHGRM